MGLIIGDRAEVAWPCAHDGLKGKLTYVNSTAGFAVMECDRPNPRTGETIILKYPLKAFIPEKGGKK